MGGLTMFGGILTKALLGVILALVISNGYTYVKYNWFERPRLEKEISELQEAGIKAQAEIYRQKAMLADREYVQERREVKNRDTKKIDKVVQDNDDPAMRDVFVGLGMLATDKNRPPGPGKTGGPGDLPRTEGVPAPVH
jgi:hypothetical protein